MAATKVDGVKSALLSRCSVERVNPDGSRERIRLVWDFDLKEWVPV